MIVKTYTKKEKRTQAVVDAENKLIDKAAAPAEANLRQGDLLKTDDGYKTASDRLRLLVERVERLNEERAGVVDDIREVYGEAKSAGFDVKAMRAIVRLRGLPTDHRREQEELLELYKSALGLR